MKIAAAVLGVLVVAAFSVWFFLFRAPSAETVCTHLREVAKKELGELGEKAVKIDQCVADANRHAETKGLAFVAKERKCILNAETLDAVAACGK